MNSAIIRRLETLERGAPRAGIATSVELPYLNTLTEEEKFDLCAYAFSVDGSRPWPAHRARREDGYYEALMGKAAGEKL